jgi:hypothetical protein
MEEWDFHNTADWVNANSFARVRAAEPPPQPSPPPLMT